MPDPPIPFDVSVGKVDSAEHPNDQLQTFIFSATMSKDLQRDLKRNKRRKFNPKRKEESSTLGMPFSLLLLSLWYKSTRRSPQEA